MNMQAVTMYTGAFCPYCTMAKRLLHAAGVENIGEIRVDTNPETFAEMQQRSGQRSVPQISSAKRMSADSPTCTAFSRKASWTNY